MHLLPESDDAQDQVPRLRRFRARYPDIEIRDPVSARRGYWSAYRDGIRLAAEYDLHTLLDHLDLLLA